MNTAASLRRFGAPSRPLIGFVAAHLAILAATLLAIEAAGLQLPAAANNDAAAAFRLEAIFVGLCLIAIAARREHRTSYALESALPLSLAGIGLSLGWLLATLWLNLDAVTYRPLAGSLPAIALMASCTLPWLLLGRYLGG